MTSQQRLMSILIGVVGAIGSCVALAGFLLKMRRNGLELPEAVTRQAFYQSVGGAYSGGFVAGFSLCFFLTLLAVAIGTWLEKRDIGRIRETKTVPIPLVGSDSRR